ncbi:MAG: hypothetical protein GY765_26870, partial [bacterium]|nr:hypothetical protein [bacterium]
MKVNRLYCFLSLLVIIVASAKIVFQLDYVLMPLLFFTAGLVTALASKKIALYLFVFLFPFINAAPGLTDSSYPFNYIAVSLFLLSGMVAASVVEKVRSASAARKGKEPAGTYALEDYQDNDFRPYYGFLLILFLSTLFVLFRWSNITLDSIGAIGADTPVSPPVPDWVSKIEGKWYEQRVSFAGIFPVISLFIYFISPYIFFFIKKIKPAEGKIFTWLSYGFYVSTAIAVYQYISGSSLISDRLEKEMKQFNGGFSDFNAFGFFSGVMFVWSTYRIKQKDIWGYLTFVIALGGGILSGSRTVYIFLLAGMLNLLPLPTNMRGLSKSAGKRQKWTAVVLAVVVVVLIVFAGGTMKKRFTEGLDGKTTLYDKINGVTNGRLWMSEFSGRTIADNFVQGIGTGNFTFYLAYKNYLPFKNEGKRYTYDLPLNHYLLVFTENGVFGFLFFTFFMLYIFRRSAKKLLMGTILCSLVVNNFFWFPEAFLLFWVIAALNHNPPQGDAAQGGRFKRLSFLRVFKEKPWGRALLFLLPLLFILFNILYFTALHPVTWTKECGVRYDYGFWYPETDAGKTLRWTKGDAGVDLQLGDNGRSREFIVQCGAPLEHLPQRKQVISVYWKGELFKEIVFTENKSVS